MPASYPDKTAPAKAARGWATEAVEAAAAAWATAAKVAGEAELPDLLRGHLWLASGIMLAGLGTVPWLWTLAREYPWLVLWGLAAVCLTVHVGTLVERHGLVVLLPKWVARTFGRPLFEFLRVFVAKATLYACNVLRVGMLVCIDLTEEQSKEILEGLDPLLRRDVFQRPLSQLLPEPLQRLLLGRQWNNPRPLRARIASPETAPAPTQPRLPPPAPPAENLSPTTPASPEQPGEDGEAHAETQGGASRRDLLRKCSVDNLLEVVRGMDEVVQTTRGRGTVSMMERILSQKVAGSAVHAARAAMSSAKASAAETFEYGKTKVSELGEGVREVVVDRKAQATAASAVGGAVTLGAGGAATGLVSGGLLGAAAGIVPAIFTFGLSIPVGAAIGGGTGLCLGSTVGGTAGFFGGGAAGYHWFGRRGASQEEAAERRGSEHSQSSQGQATPSL